MYEASHHACRRANDRCELSQVSHVDLMRCRLRSLTVTCSALHVLISEVLNRLDTWATDDRLQKKRRLYDFETTNDCRRYFSFMLPDSLLEMVER